jgi:hypothetical protein
MTVANPARRGHHVAGGATRGDQRGPRVLGPALGASTHEVNVRTCRVAGGCLGHWLRSGRPVVLAQRVAEPLIHVVECLTDIPVLPGLVQQPLPGESLCDPSPQVVVD